MVPDIPADQVGIHFPSSIGVEFYLTWGGGGGGGGGGAGYIYRYW